MGCQRCSGDRICHIVGHCVDSFYAEVGDNYLYEGYVREDLGLGSGDDLRFAYCLNCGQIQRTFPLPISEIEMPEWNEDQKAKIVARAAARAARKN